jgi:orotate phosphoribosyltransferase
LVSSFIPAAPGGGGAGPTFPPAGGGATGCGSALDRQEAASDGGPHSAAQALAAEAGVAVVAVATLDDLLAFAGESAELVAQRERLLAYRARYGCAAA